LNDGVSLDVSHGQELGSTFRAPHSAPTVPDVKTPFSDIAAVSFDFYNTLVYHRAGLGRGARLMEYLREQRVFRRLNVRAPDGAAAEHAANLWELLGPDCLVVYPEVPAVLRAMTGAGLPLVIVSNWQCGLAHFCTELGLTAFFDHIIASAEVGSAKPDAGIFIEACERLGLPPSRVLHVGDSPVDDIEGATAAGLPAVLLRREGERSDLDAPLLSNLEGLPALLGPAGTETEDRPIAAD
jgi:HAD superfamily hydrolase (TIGR01549 family)